MKNRSIQLLSSSPLPNSVNLFWPLPFPPPPPSPLQLSPSTNSPLTITSDVEFHSKLQELLLIMSAY